MDSPLPASGGENIHVESVKLVRISELRIFIECRNEVFGKIIIFELVKLFDDLFDFIDVVFFSRRRFERSLYVEVCSYLKNRRLADRGQEENLTLRANKLPLFYHLARPDIDT